MSAANTVGSIVAAMLVKPARSNCRAVGQLSQSQCAFSPFFIMSFTLCCRLQGDDAARRDSRAFASAARSLSLTFALSLARSLSLSLSLTYSLSFLLSLSSHLQDNDAARQQRDVLHARDEPLDIVLREQIMQNSMEAFEVGLAHCRVERKLVHILSSFHTEFHSTLPPASRCQLRLLDSQIRHDMMRLVSPMPPTMMVVTVSRMM